MKSFFKILILITLSFSLNILGASENVAAKKVQDLARFKQLSIEVQILDLLKTEMDLSDEQIADIGWPHFKYMQQIDEQKKISAKQFGLRLCCMDTSPWIARDRSPDRKGYKAVVQELAKKQTELQKAKAALGIQPMRPA